MKLRDALGLLRLQSPEFRHTARVLRRAHDIESLRIQARRTLPQAVFDYVDGGADEELTMGVNRRSYQGRQWQPRLLRDVSEVDTGTVVFDRSWALPVGLAPTGYTRMMHPQGELAVARAARAASVPYALSTVGTTTIEDVAAVGGQRWFQLYVMRHRAGSYALVDRAAAAGFDVLEITIDTAVPGLRLRDQRNGLTIPPHLALHTVVDILRHCRYWARSLTGPAIEFANLTEAASTVDTIGSLFDDALTWDDVAELRRRWPGRLVLKGPVGVADARIALDHGVDGLHLSNHGGRQLDRCVPPLENLRAIRQTIGDDVTIVVDSGIRHGADVAMAVAAGADAVMIGRPYLYGLAAAGEPGVARVLELLHTQLRRVMALVGVTSIAQLRAEGPELLRSEPS